MATLYNDVLRYDVGNFNKTEHDHFILSKGHAGVAVYCALAIKGFFPLKDLEHYYENGSLLSGHISSYVHGVECSTGALGHGAGIGVGLALAQKSIKANFVRMFCWEMASAMREVFGRLQCLPLRKDWII